MCSCHSILECCVMFSGVKLSIRSFVLLLRQSNVDCFVERLAKSDSGNNGDCQRIS